MFPLIQLSINVVDLNDSPAFVALSYTWGSPFPPESDQSKAYGPMNNFPVVLDGEIFFVTKNLYEFLQQLKTGELDVDQRTEPYNKTGLIEAAENGDENYLMFWLGRGADLAAQDVFGETALHYAAENGHFEIVKTLVGAGSDVHMRDGKGRTPLDCAKLWECGQFAETIGYLERADIDELVGSTPQPLFHMDSRRFWIDAICINQNDIPERNAQVAIMSMIYTKASGVFVWLGVEDESTELAFGMIHYPDQPSMCLWYRDVAKSCSINSPADSVSKKGASEAALQYQAIVRFFTRSWFTRVWIIQEVALAKQIRVFCGRHEFIYFKLFEALHHPRLPSRINRRILAQALELARWKGFGGSELSILTDIRVRTSKYAFERSRVIPCHVREEGISLVPTWEDKLSLPLLASRVWSFRATDPRDKVFALIGASRLCEDPTHSIVADYSTSTVEVFTRFGQIFMQGAPNEPFQSWQTGACEVFERLEGLSFVQRNPHSPHSLDGRSLPSWVPDFTAPLVSPRLWSSRFAAGGICDNRDMILPGDDPCTLKLTGTLVDEIDYVEESTGEVTEIQFGPRSWLQFIAGLDLKYTPTGQSRVEALWQTLMAGYLSLTSKDPIGDARSSFRYFIQRALWADPSGTKEDKTKDINLVREFDDSNSLPSWEEVEQYGVAQDRIGKTDGAVKINNGDFDQAFTHFHLGRLLYRTKKGYLGLGPWHVHPGDEVWVISGTRTPFVLGKTSTPGSDTKSRRFIGETYVHGLMNGEASHDDHVFEPISLV
ncbi:hypothetical protein AWENTII_007384 [Aspergillus wentii]